MSAADPHTDDLAAFLSEQADSYARLASDTYGRPDDAVRDELLDTESKFRAAAAELRRLRDRDAALTRLLDAVGDAEGLWIVTADMHHGDPEAVAHATHVLRRIAAAVEGIDLKERPSVCPTCGSDDPQLFRPFRPAKDPWMLHGCPDPWHGGAE